MIIRVSGERIELVTEDYYEKELKYQDEINALRNAATLKKEMTFEQKGNQVLIQLPLALIQDSIKGSVHFYKPSDKKGDKLYLLKPDKKNILSFPVSDLHNGLYKITVDLEYLGEDYKIKSDIYIE